MRKALVFISAFALVRASPHAETLAGLERKLKAVVGDGTCVAHGQSGALVSSG